MTARQRVAVLGGDGRFHHTSLVGCDVRIFQACRFGGNGQLKRLEMALRAGGVDRLVVLARWNGHSATRAAFRLCRKLGIPIAVIP